MDIVHDVQISILNELVFTSDHSTLLTCGLVCKRWLQYTRPPIFDATEIWVWAVEPTHPHYSRTRSFINLTQSSISTFPLYLSRLSLCEEPAHPASKPTYSAILRSISLLSALRTLTIESPERKKVPPQLRTLLSGLRNVTKLIMGSYAFQDPREAYMATIGTFVSLQEVVIGGLCTNVDPQPGQPSDLGDYSLDLLDITLHGSHPSHMIKPFLVASGHIRNLKIRGVRGVIDSGDIQSLLGNVGDSLVHASFGCQDLQPVTSQGGAMIATEFPINLSSNRKLVSLTVEMLIAPTPSSMVPESYWLLDMCKTIASQKFSVLNLKLTLHPIILTVPMNVVVNFPPFLKTLGKSGVFPRVRLMFNFTETAEELTHERLRAATEEIQTELKPIYDQKKLEIDWSGYYGSVV